MSVVSGLYASAAVLLVVAGATKLSRPGAGATGLLGFRAGSGVVRLVGVGEAAVGVAALWLGGPVAATAAGLIVGLAYAAFAAAVLRALRAGSGSCGCFGALDAPPSRIHVGVNLALAAASFAAVATGGASEAPVAAVAAVFAEQPTEAAALVVEIVVLAGLALVSLTALPEALAARTPRPRSAGSGLFHALAVSRAPSAPPLPSPSPSPSSAPHGREAPNTRRRLLPGGRR